jgi:D-serine deaminase-like pyridoxal phosphate-dependent protein
MSRNTSRGLAVVDAGLKAVSLDSGPPLLPRQNGDSPLVEFKSGGDEHGLLLWPQVYPLSYLKIQYNTLQ